MPMSPAQTWTKTKGFTLLELMVVMVVLAMAFSFVAINWGGLVRKEEDSFFSRFSLEASILREEAVSAFQQRAIEIDFTANSITAGAVDLQTGITPFRSLGVPYGLTVKDAIVNGRKFSTGKVVVRFYPTGLVDRTILHLEGGREGSYSIIIQPLTARVEIRNGHIEEIEVPPGSYPS